MKKIFLCLIALFSASFAQEKLPEIKVDQAAAFMRVYATLYQKTTEVCHEKGYPYFLLKNISYRDELGQKMEIQGTGNFQGGESIKGTFQEENLQNMFSNKIEYELIAFREKPKDERAIDVEGFLRMVRAFEEPSPEVVEGSNVKEITNIEELNQILREAKTPVFLDCYTDMCPPCKVLSPKYEKYSIDFSSKGKFLKANLATVQEITNTYGITMVPAVLIFEDNKLKETKLGLPDILTYFETLH